MWKWTPWFALVFGCVSENSTTPRCGDNTLDADEICDGALFASDFRCSDGQPPLGCNGCVPECATASTCGNGFLDAGEPCDGANVPACPSGMVGEVTCSGNCELDTSACVAGGEVTVHVVQGTANLPNFYVVSHMPDGTPIGECTTNSAGLCILTGVPADGMVTIGHTWPMGLTQTQLLTTFTHLTPPQTIEFVIPPPPPSGTVTQANAYVPGSYAGATTAVTMNGCGTVEQADFSTVHEHAFAPACINASQEGGVYAEARDASGITLAWSYLRQAIVGTPTFTLPAWSASFSTLMTQMTNVPNGTTVLRLGCNALVDQLIPLGQSRDAAPPTTTETLAMTVPSSITSARCTVSLGISTQQGMQTCEQRQTPPFTTFAFDGSHLLPPMTSTFSLGSPSAIDRWTCTLASQPTPNADVSECFKGFYLGGTPSTNIGWTLVAPGSFIGMLIAPRLGPSAPFSFSNVQDTPVTGHSRRFDYSEIAGYSDYLDGRVEPATGETCAVFHSQH